MCFSAGASFGVAGVLAGIGLVAVAGNASRSHRMFAVTPFLFAAQQAIEGIVWLTVQSQSHTVVHQVAVTLYLALALVLWPGWVPWSLQRAERNASRRHALTLLLRFGCAVAAGAAFMLWRWQPAAVVAGHSIQYAFAGSSEGVVYAALVLAYVIPTIAPFLVSTTRLARTIGIMTAVSLIATALIKEGALTSVWCFFAAILSGVILIAVRREQASAAMRLA